MDSFGWKDMIESFDERRDIIIPGAYIETIHFCVKQFLQIAHNAIEERGRFTVAVSGGSTPNAIFALLSKTENKEQIDWNKVFLFWSDERSVPPDHPDSNFHMAMEAGLDQLPIPKEQIFRMEAETNIEEHAARYEQLIKTHVPNGIFDLVMLGMGEDGHTASLFPHTHGLQAENRFVIANYVPQKETWRMSLTYECINQARHICIYVLGQNKGEMVAQALLSPYRPDHLPIQKIGTAQHKALWILDQAASQMLINKL
jgi:6-phosphogluconolactonase